MDKLFNRIGTLSLEKSESCALDWFCRAFLERNGIITQELFPFIQSSLKTKSFQDRVLRLHTEKYEKEKRKIIDEMTKRSSHPNTAAFYQPQLACLAERLNVKTFGALLNYIEKEQTQNPGISFILSNAYKAIHGENDDDYISRNYKYYYMGSLLYNSFSSMKHRNELLEQKCAASVLDEYQAISIDLNKTDIQFSKYKLLSKNKHISIHNDKDSQTIVDSRIGKYFYIEVPKKLLTSIQELISKDYIDQISFRVDSISEFIPSMEDLEFGTKLGFNVSSLPDASKFYSTKKYANSLWITHDESKNSLTFEELLEDFEVFSELVVTQVVHLEYKRKEHKFFISHLDHEFIFYTIEEYDARELTSDVKGHKKVKTFKIDNSEIPFFYQSNNEFFLYQVLDSYMSNKDLLSEYFENIINECS